MNSAMFGERLVVLLMPFPDSLQRRILVVKVNKPFKKKGYYTCSVVQVYVLLCSGSGSTLASFYQLWDSRQQGFQNATKTNTLILQTLQKKE